MIYIIIMYTTKSSLAPANRLLSVYFFGVGASRGGGLLVVVLRAMNRRNGEREKEGNRTGLTDSSIGTQRSLKKEREQER